MVGGMTQVRSQRAAQRSDYKYEDEQRKCQFQRNSQFDDTDFSVSKEKSKNTIRSCKLRSRKNDIAESEEERRPGRSEKICAASSAKQNIQAEPKEKKSVVHVSTNLHGICYNVQMRGTFFDFIDCVKNSVAHGTVYGKVFENRCPDLTTFSGISGAVVAFSVVSMETQGLSVPA